MSNISAAQGNHWAAKTWAHCRICSWQPTSFLGQSRPRLTSSIHDCSPYGMSGKCFQTRRETLSPTFQRFCQLTSDLLFFCIGFEKHLPISLGLSTFQPSLQDTHISLLFLIHSHYSQPHTQSKQKPFRSTKPSTRLHKNDSSHMSLQTPCQTVLCCIYIVLTSTKLPSQQENIHPFTFLNKA